MEPAATPDATALSDPPAGKHAPTACSAFITLCRPTSRVVASNEPQGPSNVTRVPLIDTASTVATQGRTRSFTGPSASEGVQRITPGTPSLALGPVMKPSITPARHPSTLSA